MNVTVCLSFLEPDADWKKRGKIVFPYGNFLVFSIPCGGLVEKVIEAGCKSDPNVTSSSLPFVNLRRRQLITCDSLNVSLIKPLCWTAQLFLSRCSSGIKLVSDKFVTLIKTPRWCSSVIHIPMSWTLLFVMMFTRVSETCLRGVSCLVLFGAFLLPLNWDAWKVSDQWAHAVDCVCCDPVSCVWGAEGHVTPNAALAEIFLCFLESTTCDLMAEQEQSQIISPAFSCHREKSLSCKLLFSWDKHICLSESLQRCSKCAEWSQSEVCCFVFVSFS